MEEYQEGLGKFCSHTRFEVGDGSKVRFQHNPWYGDTALKEAFPFLFGIACLQGAFVATLMEFSRGDIQWNVSCTRVAQ